MFTYRRTYISLLVILVMVGLVLGACVSAPSASPATTAPEVATPTEAAALAPTTVPSTSGPTPVATGLASYVPPTGGLLSEIKQRGVLINGVNCANPPGEYYDTGSTKCTGFSIDLAQKLADSLGVKLEVIDTDWAGVIPSLYANKFDMILSSMTITEARKKAVSFSKPVGCDQVVWITRQGDSRITKPADLNNMIVSTQLNSAAEAQAQDLQTSQNVKYKNLMSFDTFQTAYLAVKNGQADIATSTLWNNIPLFKSEPGVFQVAFSLPIYNYVGIAIRQQDADLLQYVNSFLDKEEASGDLGNLQYKYYGYGMNCGDQGPNLPAGWVAPAP